MHEGIPILNFLVPKEFMHDNGKLTGMHLREGAAPNTTPRAGAAWCRPASPTCYRLRRRAGGGRPGERLPLDRARHRHRVRQVGHAGARPDDAAVDAARRCSSAATRPSARRTSSGRWRTATRRRSRSTSFCHGEDVDASGRRRMVNLISQKMGIHEWSYDNDDRRDDARYKVPLGDTAERAARTSRSRSNSASTRELALQGGAALPQLRRADGVHRASSASSATPASTSARWTASPSPRNGEEAELRARLKAPAHEPDAGPLCLGRAEDRPRHGQGRGRLPALRPVRRALPDRRLGHAEIPARDDPRRAGMPRQHSDAWSTHEAHREPSTISSSSSPTSTARARPRANELFARADPAHGRAGRRRATSSRRTSRACRPGTRCASSEAGWLGPARRRRPDGGDEPADLGPRRRRDRARRLPVLRFDQAAAAVEVPRRHHGARHAADRDLQRDLHRSAPAPAVQEHHLCRRAGGAARHGRRRSSRS